MTKSNNRSESHSAAESSYRRLSKLPVRAVDALTKQQRDDLEARRIAEREKNDTQTADEWVRQNGGW